MCRFKTLGYKKLIKSTGYSEFEISFYVFDSDCSPGSRNETKNEDVSMFFCSPLVFSKTILLGVLNLSLTWIAHPVPL